MQQEMLNGFRLSQQQARLWAVQRDSDPLCAQAAVQIGGPLNVDRLRRAIQTVVANNEILRTNFARLAGMPLPVQVVSDDHTSELSILSTDDIGWQVDAAALADESLLQELCQQIFAGERSRLGDLNHDAPLHSALLTLADTRHLLFLSLPTLCGDGWSLRNLVGEIGAAYARPTMDEDEEILQYAQFAEWQHEILTDGEDADDERAVGQAYWQQSLADASDLMLPYQCQPAENGQFSPEGLPTQLSSVTMTQLNAAAEVVETTPTAFLLACWQTVLWRVSGQTDVVVGVSSDGRPHEMLHDLLGLFAGTLPIRSRVEANLRVRDLVARCDQALDDAETWQDYIPWQEIDSPTVGFEYMPACEPLHYGDIVLSICQQQIVTDPFGAKLLCQPVGDSLTTILEYDPARFAPQAMQRLLRTFGTLLHHAVRDVDALLGNLDLLDEAERQQLLVGFNDTAADVAQTPLLHERFAQYAVDKPDAVALVCGEQQLTYRELNNRANQLAHYLNSHNIGPDVPVGLCMARSPEMIVGLLAILKAGAAYLPLDPMYPLERLAYTLENAKATILLTQANLIAGQQANFHGLQPILVDQLDEELANQPTTDPVSQTSAQNLAYVIYTSGSTGTPKGVMIRHGAVMNLGVALHESVYQVEQDRALRVSLNAPITFDSSVKQLVQLSYGHSLYLIPEEIRPDGEALLAFVHDQKVDVIDCTPSQLRLLLDAGLGKNPERDPALVLVGGEAIDPVLWAQLSQISGTRFCNVYGPTECTVDTTSSVISSTLNEPTIGQPLANTQLYILDNRMRPVPLGTPGELYIGGAGLARGYLNAPDLTAERFIPNPFSREPGNRLYRTGDLAAYLEDGNVKFLGRADHQIKLRGFRIELGEIETVLNEHPIVRESVVVVREDLQDDPRLVGYFVERDADNGTAPEIRTFLRTRLPEYMIPSTFVPLKELPLTRNGKVDRRALPAPDSVRAASARNFVAPRNQFEQTIAHVWQEVLAVEKVGADDNFFDLGGHSLLMVKVHHSLRSAFDRDISLMDMFRNTTVAQLAEYLSQDIPQELTVESGTDRGETRKAARDKRRKRQQKRSKVHA